MKKESKKEENAMEKIRNYGRFYGLLKEMPGAEKEALVAEFTGGRTDSLREMHDTEYAAMLVAMEYQKASEKGGFVEYDIWRKRVIAAICGTFGDRMDGEDITDDRRRVAYAKSIACRAAGCETFNSIPTNKLRGLYAEFVNRQNIRGVVAGIPRISMN